MATTAETLAHGWRIHQANEFAAAEQIYRQVLKVDPNNADAWCYLGIACHDQDRFEEAVAAYRRAIAVQPKFPIAFNNLGNSLEMLRRFDESIACFDQALELKPDYVNAMKNKGTALVWKGHARDALASYRRALQLAPDDAETHKFIGVILLLLGDFENGWSEYQWRWKTDEVTLPQYDQPLWDGSSLDGRTILLTAEQGFGDTVHFARYAALLRQEYDCRVVVACQRRLVPLLRTCPGIDQLVVSDETPPPFDVFAPLLDLPGLLRHTPDSFPAKVPYLAASPDRVAEWKQKLAAFGGFRIGLMWQGNPGYHVDRLRSFPLAELAPLARLEGIHLFSLQKGVGVEQLDTINGRLDIVPLGDALDENTGAFEETAAVLQNLDLLISCDSAVAHVAGALGVPVWLALHCVPDWRWLLDREDSPWYPHTRLFRQTKSGDWTNVFHEMADRLPSESQMIRRCRPEDYRLLTSGANRLVRNREGVVLFNRHDQYIGASIERYGDFSEGEAGLFRQIIRPGSVVVEAGANIGVHTLALSRSVGERGVVYAFEPQRQLFQILCANVALNGRTNVFAFCEAVGDAAGFICVPTLDYDQENNFGGLALGASQNGAQVRVRTVDDLELPRCDLIKADVEGMELAVLRGATKTIDRCHPLLYVENDRQDRSAALIQWILANGYRLYWHLPPMYSPDNWFGNRENTFPSIVSANMLGVHQAVKSQISGLREIRGPDSDWRKPGD